jgi:hypothetical protein
VVAHRHQVGIEIKKKAASCLLETPLSFIPYNTLKAEVKAIFSSVFIVPHCIKRPFFALQE